jgi:RNA polymerase sigma-70 factor, ECF subfamily
MNDLFLIQQTLNGNTNAFRFLVLRYQKPLFNYLFSFSLAGQVIEDVAQETFVRAFKNLSTYEPGKGASFATWLFVIAKNLAINETKRAFHKNEVPSEVSGEEDSDFKSYADTVADNPESLFSQKQTQKVVQLALGEVPSDFRRAVILSQLLEHSLEEISIIENCSLGTVKSRIYRGKEILRKLLSRHLETL